MQNIFKKVKKTDPFATVQTNLVLKLNTTCQWSQPLHLGKQSQTTTESDTEPTISVSIEMQEMAFSQ